METHLHKSQENCKEKIAEITAKGLEIANLENISKNARLEIEGNLQELTLRASQLAECQQNLDAAKTQIVERNNLIEVSTIYYLSWLIYITKDKAFQGE